jgi:Serine/threonine protein kinase
VISLVIVVLNALFVVHQRGVVHRDLKFDNIFVVSDGRGGQTAKVLDFGIAKVMDAVGGMGSKTKMGILLGMPGYMSSEQIKNAKGVDARSDLWSVGIILYEMLSG